MRIRVNSESANFSLNLPTAMLLNGLTARIATAAINGRMPDASFTPHQLRRIFREIRAIQADFSDWVLVDVHSADGDEVLITF